MPDYRIEAEPIEITRGRYGIPLEPTRRFTTGPSRYYRDDVEITEAEYCQAMTRTCEYCGNPTSQRYCDEDCRDADKSGSGPKACAFIAGRTGPLRLAWPRRRPMRDRRTGALMPFKNRAQMRAMFAKGGKSAATAKQWVKKYGVPGGRKKTKSKGKGKT